MSLLPRQARDCCAGRQTAARQRTWCSRRQSHCAAPCAGSWPLQDDHACCLSKSACTISVNQSHVLLRTAQEICWEQRLRNNAFCVHAVAVHWRKQLQRSLAFFAMETALPVMCNRWTFLWSPYNRADHYIFIMWFSLLLFLLSFFSPNLSRRRLDVCHTSTHGVTLVRI